MFNRLCFLLLVSTLGASAQYQPTPNIGLEIPANGSTNWNIPLNYNFNRLDQMLSGNLAIPGLSVSGNVTVIGSVTAGSFIGAGGSGFALTHGSVPGAIPWFSGTGGSSSTIDGVNSAGIPFYPGGAAPRTSTYSDVVHLWASGSCMGFLKNDGTCGNIAGINSAVQYSIPWYSTAGTNNTLSGVAFNGIVKASTTASPSAAATSDIVSLLVGSTISANQLILTPPSASVGLTVSGNINSSAELVQAVNSNSGGYSVFAAFNDTFASGVFGVGGSAGQPALQNNGFFGCLNNCVVAIDNTGTVGGSQHFKVVAGTNNTPLFDLQQIGFTGINSQLTLPGNLIINGSISGATQSLTPPANSLGLNIVQNGSSSAFKPVIQTQNTNPLSDGQAIFIQNDTGENLSFGMGGSAVTRFDLQQGWIASTKAFRNITDGFSNSPTNCWAHYAGNSGTLRVFETCPGSPSVGTMYGNLVATGDVRAATGHFGGSASGNQPCILNGTNCTIPHPDYVFIPTSLTLPTNTMLGPIFYEALATHLIQINVRTKGSTCTVAPVVNFMDLGTSFGAAFGSATTLANLTLGTTDGAFQITGSNSIASGHYVGVAITGGTCTQWPQFDIVGQMQ